MKKLDTLKKLLATADENALNTELTAIICNDDVKANELSEFEKLSVLMFAEIAKAVKTKEHTLVLDCNYANSKNDTLKVDYYRLAIANAMIQVYVRKNSFRICTSASKANREQFKQLENELHFVTKYDKKTNRAKTTERINISYEDIVDVIKSVVAVLENTVKHSEEQQEEQ